MAKSRNSSSKSHRSTRTRKKSKTSSLKFYLGIAALSILTLSILLAMAGWLGYERGREEALQSCQTKVTHYRKDIERLRKKLAQVPTSHDLSSSGRSIKSAQKRITQTSQAKRTNGANLSEIKDYTSAGGSEGIPSPKKPTLLAKRPKLVIIIDDVAYPSQLKAIRALPWHITPSLFPPTSRHPETPKMASKLSHYMIHLPMEAMHYAHPEEKTLTIRSDEKEIEQRIRQLRRWFPKTHFINNHTGSKFTSDLESMQRFYPIARDYGFIFVDSRTTPKTVVPKICKSYHLPYLARDIFLDNKPDLTYIRRQLAKAVRIAKVHGYAIAIGHPHATTLRALKSSTDILDGVEVFYIDELYDKIR